MDRRPSPRDLIRWGVLIFVGALISLIGSSGPEQSLWAASPPTSIPQREGPLSWELIRERMSEAIAQAEGLPEAALQLESVLDVDFPLTGVQIWKAKALDSRTGASYAVAMGPTGQPVDLAGLQMAEVLARWQTSGKLTPELHQALQTSGQKAALPVGIWLQLPAESLERISALGRDRAALMEEGARRRTLAEVAALHTQAESGLLTFLSRRGYEASYASSLAPLIFAELPASLISEVEARPEVEEIYLQQEYQPALDKATKSVRADVVWARGITGFGAHTIGVVEVGPRSRIDFAGNAYLSRLPGGAFDGGDALGSHSTEVAGVIAAQKSPADHYNGVAYGISNLLSANAPSGWTSHLVQVSEWAIRQGADILNASLQQNVSGVLGNDLLARYFDYIVRQPPYITVVVAVGNIDRPANPTEHFVKSPGIAYNVISVGGYDDHDTFVWADDTMWTGSCYQDPPGTDRELPHVVAVGRNVTMPSVGGALVTASGTSYASPAVAGEVALIAQQRPGLLAYPEALRAIVMASACHDIQPGQERDGAGGIVCCEADEVVSKDQYATRWLTRSVTTAPWNTNAPLIGGLKTRVALSWLSNPRREQITGTWAQVVYVAADSITWMRDEANPFGASNSKVGWLLNPDTNQANIYPVVMNTDRWVGVRGDIRAIVGVGDDYQLFSFSSDPLRADLDLRVYDPNGALVASSLSWDNSYEYVEFIPPGSGSYRLQVRAHRFEGVLEPAAVAWSQDPCCSPDFGDAPDSYRTILSSNGARIREFEVEWLGPGDPSATLETDARKANLDADGIDNILDNDWLDDGVLLFPPYKPGIKQADFLACMDDKNWRDHIRYSGQADEMIYVDGWFDWNRNGSFDHPGERMVARALDPSTWDNRCRWFQNAFTVPANPWWLPLWVRFRLNYGQPPLRIPQGRATYGEVEDYLVWAGWDYNIDVPLPKTILPPTDLHVTLYGPGRIYTHYTGELNPFGLPTYAGYDLETGQYHIEYESEEPIPAEKSVHIGFSVDSSYVNFPYVMEMSPIYWTRDGTPVGTSVPTPGFAWKYVPEHSSAYLQLNNFDMQALHIEGLQFTVVEEPIPLEELTWEGTNDLEWQEEMEPFDIEPEMHTDWFAVEAIPGQSILFRGSWSFGVGPEVSQLISPTRGIGQYVVADTALGLVERSAPASVVPGQPYTYTFEVTERDPITVTHTLITARLPSDVEFGAACPSYTFTPTEGLISWDLGDLALQTVSTTVWVTASEDLSPGQELVGHAQATANLGYAAELTTTLEVTTCPLIEGLAISYTPEAPSVTGRQPVTISFQGWAQEGLLPLSYSWGFGDGSSGTGPQVGHAYAATGTFTVTLQAASFCRTATCTEVLQIAEAPIPVAGVGFTYTPISPTRDIPVSFTATVTQGTEPIYYLWDFGDGWLGGGQTVSHTFDISGTITVNVTAINATGSDTYAESLTFGEPSKCYLPVILKTAL